MAKFSIQAGSTSQSVNVFVQNSGSTTGVGLTGLVFNTASLAAYYSFGGAATASTKITLATLASLATAYASGGFKEIDSTNMPGLYRLDLPNAAVASGSGNFVTLYLQGASGMAPVVAEIELWAVNPSSTGFGLSNVSSNIVQVGGSAVSATTAQLGVNVVNWNNTVVASPATAGIPDINVKNIAGSAVSASTAQLGVNLVNIAGSAVSTGTAQLGVNVVNWGTTAVGAVPPDTIFMRSGTAQAGGASTITLDSGASATNSFYNGAVIFIRSGTGAGQTNIITGYVGSTKVATVGVAWATQPTSSSVFSIMAFGPSAGSVSGTVTANVTQWGGSNIATPNVAGVPIVDVGYWLGNATAATASGIPNVNVVTVAGAASNIKKNQALADFEFLMTDSTFHQPMTGLTITSMASLNGGSFGATTNSAAEVGSGVYAINLAAADLDANTVMLKFSATGADTRFIEIITQP